jgi:hypothetical protein
MVFLTTTPALFASDESPVMLPMLRQADRGKRQDYMAQRSYSVKVASSASIEA